MALYLFPALISESSELCIPAMNTALLNKMDFFFVENEKNARRQLRAMGYTGGLDAEFLVPMAKGADPEEMYRGIQRLKSGESAGVVSDAGSPGIADPGTDIVSAAHAQGIEVVPLVGPTSISLALAGSGLGGQRFTFHGYLPIPDKDRLRAIKDMERGAIAGSTQICIETPYRNDQLFTAFLQHLMPECRLCLAVELTGAQGWVRTRSISDWQAQLVKIGKKPAAFLVGM